ncbi:hypothetical protein OXX69_011904, partial [Metschnikowia pulcherrima]
YVSGPTLELFQDQNVNKSHLTTIDDMEAVKASIMYYNDFGTLVEPACGAALSVVYNHIAYLEKCLPDLNKDDIVVIVVCGGSCTNEEVLSDYRKMIRESHIHGVYTNSGHVKHPQPSASNANSSLQNPLYSFPQDAISGPLRDICQTTFFQSYSKRTQLEFPHDRLSPHIKKLREDANYSAFWKKIKASTMKSNRSLPYLHLFHLGYDIGCYANADHCSLCKMPFSTDATQETRTQHIYFACTVSKDIWRACDITNQPLIRLVVGSINPASPKIDKFLYYLGQFIRTRRRMALETRGADGLAATATLPDLNPDTISRNMNHYKVNYGKHF